MILIIRNPAPGLSAKRAGKWMFPAYCFTKEIAIAVSRLGASKAIALGAYAYALAQLDAGAV